MKNRIIFMLMLMTALLSSTFTLSAQFDDLYYDPATDDPYYEYSQSDDTFADGEESYYYDDESYEYGDYDDYDYYYASRIRRFHRPVTVFDYYDPFYTDMYYYDPFYYSNYYSPGVSIYFSFGNPYRPWRSWYRSHYYYSNYYYNSWYDPWYNDPWYYNSWGWGNNHYYTNNYYYGYGGYHNPYYYYNSPHYNNNYHHAGYYFGENKYGKGKEYGSRYGGSTVSSTRGKVREPGIIGTPKTDKGILGDTRGAEGRSGFSDPTKSGVNDGTFKGDREIKPRFEQDRKSTETPQKQWVPFGENSRPQSGSNRGSLDNPTKDKPAYRSEPEKSSRSSQAPDIRTKAPAKQSGDSWKQSSGSKQKESYKNNSSSGRSSGYESPSRKSSGSSVSRSSGTSSRSSGSSVSRSSGSSSKSSGSSVSRSSGSSSRSSGVSSSSSSGSSRSSGSSSSRSSGSSSSSRSSSSRSGR